MHRAISVIVLALVLVSSAWDGSRAVPLNDIIEDETPEQLCDRLAGDPFSGFGPDEWSQPFSTVDYYRALPACTEALKAHPGEQRFELGMALANIAGNKRDAAKPILEDLRGWHSRTSGTTKRSGLPNEAIEYLARLETLAGAPISIVSTGPARAATIPFASV